MDVTQGRVLGEWLGLDGDALAFMLKAIRKDCAASCGPCTDQARH